MKNHSASPSAPCEAAIRDYAFHLYEQSGCLPGRDLDNWLEASMCLHARAAAPAPEVVVREPEVVVREPESKATLVASEPGHVHAAAGHARAVKEKTAHTNSHRHS